jgi:hypothetical protein
MKKILILFVLFFIFPAHSQFIPAYDSGTQLPTVTTDYAKPFFLLPDSIIYVRYRGQWIVSDNQLTLKPISSIASGTTDSTKFITKTNLDSVKLNRTLITDPRLSDARIPRSHSHLESDVTNLTTDLTAKLAITAVKSGAYWDTSRIVFGKVTIPKGDSIQVAIAGVTATSIVTTAYQGGRMVCDTVASFIIPANGKITLYGKFNKIVSYTVIK